MYGLFLLSLVGFASSDVETEELFATEPIQPHLNMTFFPPLNNMQNLSETVRQSDYPWIARLVHSTSASFPHVCTATCISERIFVSAARCIFRLKVAYTRVWYRAEYIAARAFVVPTWASKQRYQDVGLVVTRPHRPAGGWARLRPFADANRTDSKFAWFHELHLENNRQDFYAIGYALTTRQAPLNYEGIYQLYLMNVVIDMYLCNKITRWDEDSDDYFVPCYHSCSILEHKHNEDRCRGYLGVEGGAVVDVKTDTLMGVATWGAYAANQHLPVGMAIPNSRNYYRDYDCALKIREDNSDRPGPDLYSELCREKRP